MDNDSNKFFVNQPAVVAKPDFQKCAQSIVKTYRSLGDYLLTERIAYELEETWEMAKAFAAQTTHTKEEPLPSKRPHS